MTYRAVNDTRWICIEDSEVEMYYNAGYKIFKAIEIELDDDEIQEIIDKFGTDEI